MFKDAEVPQGPIDGVNRVFTLEAAPYPKESLLLVLNGLVQRRGVDYTLEGNIITYASPPQPGDSHLAWYRTSVLLGEPGEPGVPGITRTQAIGLIAARLGNRTGLDEYILTELMMAQDSLEATEPLPWFLIATASLVTMAGVDRVTLPVDFVREYAEAGHESSLTVEASDGWRPLRKVGVQTLLDLLPASGLPTKYAVVGRYVRLHPTPDAAYNMSMLYYSRDTRLSEVEKNAWLTYAPDLLVAKAGLQVARFLRDMNAVALFKEDLAVAAARLAQHIVARSTVSTDPRLRGFEYD